MGLSVSWSWALVFAQSCAHWPGVTVILPVKECRQFCQDNWRSQLGTLYDGEISFIFVVESMDDPAAAAVRAILMEFPGIDARILVAGSARSCSQKIHNQVAGLRAAASSARYVLFMDDDIAVHPYALSMTVEMLETNPQLFMATGYPFDIPQNCCSFLTWMVLVYHLPLVIPFSISDRAQFVWGGFMLLRADKLLDPKYGIVDAWLHGGYSDDLILASKCTQHGLQIATPAHAIFPQRLRKRYTWGEYWNYLKRQLYVLDTYSNHHNRTTNHIMMALHSWFSLMWLVAVTASVCQIVHWGLSAAAEGSFAGSRGHSPMLDPCPAPASYSMWPSTLVLAACCAAHVGLKFMIGEVLALFRVTFPSQPQFHAVGFSWWAVWAAMLAESIVLPLCTVAMLLTPTISWSGVTYSRRRGRVVRQS